MTAFSRSRQTARASPSAPTVLVPWRFTSRVSCPGSTAIAIDRATASTTSGRPGLPTRNSSRITRWPRTASGSCRLAVERREKSPTSAHIQRGRPMAASWPFNRCQPRIAAARKFRDALDDLDRGRDRPPPSDGRDHAESRQARTSHRHGCPTRDGSCSPFRRIRDQNAGLRCGAWTLRHVVSWKSARTN